MRTLAARFGEHADRRPGASALFSGALTYTRQDVASQAQRLAGALHDLGVRRHDRVAIVQRNSPLHFTALLACTTLGATFVPLNFRLSPWEVARTLRDCTPRVTLCDPSHGEALAKAGDLFAPTTWVVDDHDQAALAKTSLSDQWRHLSHLLADPSPLPAQPATVNADDLVMIQYTSGSTGCPKGVCFTYANLEGSWTNFAATAPLTADDVALGLTPFGHVGGLNSFSLQALLAGGAVLIEQRFDVAQTLRDIETHRATHMFAVPAIYEELARHSDFARRDLSSLRVLLVGGAPAPQHLLQTYHRANIPLWVSWGMTETCGAATLLPPTAGPDHPGSVGRACPATQLRIAEPGTFTDVNSPGALGELLVRGNNVSAHYWSGAATPSHLRDGWLRTGDLGRIDAHGWCYLTGRIKDIIISGGENIHPCEIEHRLREHPQVSEVAVVGVPDPRWGETPLAFIVPSDPLNPPTIAGVREFLGAWLAHYKLPRQLRIVQSLPLTSAGKVDRAQLAAAGHDTPNPPASGH